MESSQAHNLSIGARLQGARGASNQELVGVAARVLERALVAQVRPAMGMYVHPSTAENDAFQSAVHAICIEALRLDLRAEELLISIKQAWSQLAPLRARHLGERDGDVLRELVSTSIEVFFATRENRAREDG